MPITKQTPIVARVRPAFKSQLKMTPHHRNIMVQLFVPLKDALITYQDHHPTISEATIVAQFKNTVRGQLRAYTLALYPAELTMYRKLVNQLMAQLMRMLEMAMESINIHGQRLSHRIINRLTIIINARCQSIQSDWCIDYAKNIQAWGQAVRRNLRPDTDNGGEFSAH